MPLTRELRRRMNREYTLSKLQQAPFDPEDLQEKYEELQQQITHLADILQEASGLEYHVRTTIEDQQDMPWGDKILAGKVKKRGIRNLLKPSLVKAKVAPRALYMKTVTHSIRYIKVEKNAPVWVFYRPGYKELGEQIRAHLERNIEKVVNSEYLPRKVLLVLR